VRPADGLLRPANQSALYMDDKTFAARQEQVKRGANQRDTAADSTFRFDYARRAVSDGAGVGAALPAGRGGGRGRGAGAAPLPAGAATGERDQER